MIANDSDEMEKSLQLKNNPEKSDTFNGDNSIDISAIPPLDNLSITEGWNGELKFPYSVDDNESYLAITIPQSDSFVENTYFTDSKVKK